MVIPCKAIGSPKPEIKWYAAGDSSPLQNSSKYSIHSSGSLEIRNVDSQDAVKYKCTASNLVTTVVKETRVELACKWFIFV